MPRLRSLVASRRAYLLWTGCLLAFGGSLALVLWYWRGGIPLDVSSGVWTALAKDFADGVLYRPVLDGAGYGGTRYMPLFFVLHGLLIRWSLDPVVAGVILTFVSLALFDAAVYTALRQLGVRRGIAMPLALLGHATISVQLLAVNVKGDLLAAALNLGTLICALRYARRPTAAAFALMTLSPVLAVMTKISAVSGLLAGILILRQRFGTRRVAIWVGSVAATTGLALAAVYHASDGRIVDSFLSVLSGGAGLGFALRFPLWFVLVAVQDPFFFLLLLVALWYAIRSTGRATRTYAAEYFWIAILCTIPLFVSRGVDNNHLLDLLAASVLVIGQEMELGALDPTAATLIPAVLGLMSALMWIPGMISLRGVIREEGRPTRADVAAIAQVIPPGSRILSENPLVPILLGQRPVVSDPFSLRVVSSKRDSVRRDFDRRLGNEDFGAVVLVDWSGEVKGPAFGRLRARTDVGSVPFYGAVHFPPETLDLLEQHYAPAIVAPPFVVLLPRSD